jgi:hypothetical protein
MSVSPQNNPVREAVIRYAERVEIPPFDISAIRWRALELRTEHRASRRGTYRFALCIVLTVTALLLAIPSFPAIVSGVSNMVRAFVVTNGHVEHARTRNVTLDEARADMPFRVLEPQGIPSSLHLTITEVYPSADRTEAQVWFRYDSPQPGPPLTILESAASSPKSGTLLLTQTHSAGRLWTGGVTITGPPPTSCFSVTIARNGPNVQTFCKHVMSLGSGHPIPQTRCENISANRRVLTSCHGKSGVVTFSRTNGKIVTRTASMAPTRWIAHGTLVVLFNPIGILSRKQVEALRAAMSR